MKESNATTFRPTIPSGSQSELIRILFIAVQRLEERGYRPQEIERLIDGAMRQILPNSYHPLMNNSANP